MGRKREPVEVPDCYAEFDGCKRTAGVTKEGDCGFRTHCAMATKMLRGVER